MKLNGPKGSFGIPPELEAQRQRVYEEAQKKSEQQSEEGQAARGPAIPPIEDIKKDNEELIGELEPIQLLTRIGVKLEDKDFDNLIFRGFLEKDVVVIKDKLTATFKTLTGEEYDLVDELLSEEIQKTQMTRDGVDTRKSMLILSLGCTKLAGKSVTKTILKAGTDEVDLRATALARRNILSKMSPFVLDEMTKKYGTMVTAFRMIVESPESILKNS